MEAQVARQGGLGEITSVTVKADETTKAFTATIALNAEEFAKVEEGAKGAADAVIEFDKAASDAAKSAEDLNEAQPTTPTPRIPRPSFTPAPRGALPTVQRPTIAGRRAQVRDPVTAVPQREILSTADFVQQNLDESARIISEQWDKVEERISKNADNSQQAWGGFFDNVKTAF